MEMFNLGSTVNTIHFAIGSCSMGSLLVAQSSKGICAVLLGDSAQALTHDLQARFKRAQLINGGDVINESLNKVIFCVDNPHTIPLLSLDIRGTEFQQQVWAALRQIAIGTTVSYSEIAKRLGKPKAFRAVAKACAANALAVVIPCHRVVRSDGGLCGYRWGIERKKCLLQKELQSC
jgi:AraC family transcriptional regulator of adaptative response/methylated-DNA-[protein]-cysteine methyltransferase